MLIKMRSTTLSNKERNDEKLLFALNWLLEYRITSIDILAAGLGVKPNGASRFFNRLIDKKLLERVAATYSDKRDLVILGSRSASYLEGDSRDFALDIAKIRRMKEKDGLNHHLEVQKVVLRFLSKATEVISEFNISIHGKRPDSLIFIDDRCFAIELEKTHKSKKTVHLIFQQYFKMIEDDQISGVYFIFTKTDDCDRYRRYFAEENWNEAYIDPKNKSTKLTGKTIHVPFDHHLRKRFVFNSIDPKDPPKLVTLEKASSIRSTPSVAYRERIEEGILDEKVRQTMEKRKAEERQLKIEIQREADLSNRLRAERSKKYKEIRDKISKSEERDKEMKSLLPGYVSETQKFKKDLYDLVDSLLTS